MHRSTRPSKVLINRHVANEAHQDDWWVAVEVIVLAAQLQNGRLEVLYLLVTANGDIIAHQRVRPLAAIQ